MNIRHLRVFITVADLGSMTKAAEKLFIAQPSVSQTISELENYYGIRLFERLSRKLYITEEGKEFLSYARHIISSFDEMETKMKHAAKSSTLKIGASITIGTCILPEIYTHFFNHYPKVEIKTIVANTTILENMVLKSEIDFALVEGPLHSKDINSIAFMDDELILVCGPQNPLRLQKSILLKDLSNVPLILRESGSGTRELFENAMLAQGLTLNIAWVSNNTEAIKNALMTDMGVTIISRKNVEKELKNNQLFHIKIKDMEFKRKFNIIYHKNKYISKLIEDFWNLSLSFPKS